MLDLVWLIPALPLAGFLILLVAGPRLGEPAAGWLATLMTAASFVVAERSASFAVPEIAVTAMRVGSPVDIAVAPWPNERFHGEVYFVAPTLDPANRRLLLKAWVPNPDRRLRPGLFANVRLEVGHRDDALVVPEAAVAYDAQGAFVWRVGADHTAERVPVDATRST